MNSHANDLRHTMAQAGKNSPKTGPIYGGMDERGVRASKHVSGHKRARMDQAAIRSVDR